MQERVKRWLADFGFNPEAQAILVAVSGGVDSMVLASLLHEMNYSIAVAHCNFQLRAKESDSDEELVRNWCSERNIPCHIKKIETNRLVKESTESVQMVARNERYKFFEDLMDEHGYSATALAHHANDRVESVLMNVLRGTGIRGLQGMPSKRGKYIRPLLSISKTEILEFAESHKIPFRDDASNKETHYQRNWVRLRVLPMLEQLDAEAFSKILQIAERVERELPNYERWISQQGNHIIKKDEIIVDTLKDSAAPFTILKEILESKDFSTDQVFEVLELLNSDSGAKVESESHQVLKDRESLIVSELNAPKTKPRLKFELLNRSELQFLKAPKSVAFVDADLVDESELQIRLWKNGDKFKPLGMKGWKLLSDFFIDQKFSILEKENTWLLTFKDEIVWVIGHRPDNRFKVSEKTQKVLKVTVLA